MRNYYRPRQHRDYRQMSFDDIMDLFVPDEELKAT